MTDLIFQVVESRGDAGHNVEYVLKLAEWIQKNLPDVIDDHLFNIEKAVRTKIDQRNLCLISLMGETHEEELIEHNDVVHENDESGSANAGAKAASGFTSTQLRPKCVRCVKV